MCGIAGGIGRSVRAVLPALRHRGPDAEETVDVGAFWLAHARLAIQDLDPRSNQPFVRGNVVLVYNGELWNRDDLRELLRDLGEEFKTPGDTEVVAAALDRWGVEALPRLRGMFALAWTDGTTLWLSRDRHGECPLHWWPKPFAFASELKALHVVLGRKVGVWVEPGEVVEVQGDRVVRRRWYELRPHVRARGRSTPESNVRRELQHGVVDRTIADVPVCTLLSGGVDSSAIAALLKPTFPELVCYTAVHDPKGSDLAAARIVAKHLELELREVPVGKPTADDLSAIVKTIEQPHKAQVEIAWACLALARAMQKDGFKVTYSGEGSDELWGSYGFAYHGIKSEGFGPFRRGLVYDQHRKNFARANKVFMAHGVECRLPFLDTGLVETALGLTQDQVREGSSAKAVLQKAVADLLPEKIVRRPKVPFQDGCGLKEACASAVGDPARFYRAEFKKFFGASE